MRCMLEPASEETDKYCKATFTGILVMCGRNLGGDFLAAPVPKQTLFSKQLHSWAVPVLHRL